MIKYMGKCLLIEENKEKILVVGDLHFGVGEESIGSILSGEVYGQIIDDLNEIFNKTGKVNQIVLLGDLKNNFSELNQEERNDFINFFDYLERKCDKIIITKGNHDNFLINFTSKRKIELLDYYISGKYSFLHGDRDFNEIKDKNIKYWIMGHLHPAIVLSEGVKNEKYKCFLEGKWKDKKIVILPSFSGLKEGIDVKNIKNEMPWNFKLNEFEVKVVGEKLKVLEFGKLKKLD